MLLTHNTTGTATPISGLAVMYGFNDLVKVTITAGICAVVGATAGFLRSIVFKNFKIRTVSQIRVNEVQKAA
ncbi:MULTISPECIES: hypothetical protein [unclassified Peribacillus]|uniref:hypothetical protein n=1 Tax=unclassified Peribacillus TaxID=2675266 RepID=UPI001E351622|nr:hypothetical protein [Peribacillus sp. Bi96]